MESVLVKMSPKGQLVVPEDVREKEGFQPGDRFVSFPVRNGVLFRKVKVPEVKAEFEKISRDIEKHLKEKGVTSADVDEAVRWARRR